MEGQAVSVELVSAPREQESVLANLIELYIHDFSEFHPVAPGADGRFGYPCLPLYWSDADRYPFFILTNGQLAGFALVHKTASVHDRKSVWDVAEFFVLRGLRRRGIGVQAAHAVWRRFPGPWQVRVMESNVPARQFWRKAIAAFKGEAKTPLTLNHNGANWIIFRFEADSTSSR